MTQISRRLDYPRLIAVDLIVVAIVVLGLVLGVVPGVLAFVWLGLAGAVVEFERRGVLGSLRRSASLVRHNAWLVAAVLIPIELAGTALGEIISGLADSTLGEGLLVAWIADLVANLTLTPISGVAVVLLTANLIAAKDGSGPALKADASPADELVVA